MAAWHKSFCLFFQTLSHLPISVFQPSLRSRCKLIVLTSLPDLKSMCTAQNFLGLPSMIKEAVQWTFYNLNTLCIYHLMKEISCYCTSNHSVKIFYNFYHSENGLSKMQGNRKQKVYAFLYTQIILIFMVDKASEHLMISDI